MTSALVVGGTGIVSSAVVQQLLARGMHVSVFNRGLRSPSAGEGVRLIRGDRAIASDFERAFDGEQFDVVYDMIFAGVALAPQTRARGRCTRDLRRHAATRCVAR